MKSAPFTVSRCVPMVTCSWAETGPAQKKRKTAGRKRARIGATIPSPARFVRASEGMWILAPAPQHDAKHHGRHQRGQYRLARAGPNRIDRRVQRVFGHRGRLIGHVAAAESLQSRRHGRRLQLGPGRRLPVRRRRGGGEQQQSNEDGAGAHRTERDEGAVLRLEPQEQCNKAGHRRENRKDQPRHRQRRRQSERNALMLHARQRAVAEILRNRLQPRELLRQVDACDLSEAGEHQARPRDIMPMTTPTISVAPIVASGLRRAALSSSLAKVFICSVAAEVTSPATALACEATVLPTSRAALKASLPALAPSLVSVCWIELMLSLSWRTSCAS